MSQSKRRPSTRLRPKAPTAANARFSKDFPNFTDAAVAPLPSVGGDDPHSLALALARRIEAGDPSASVELYHLFVRTFAKYYARRLGIQEMDDKIQDSFLMAIRPIQRGLRDPSRLLAFSATIARRLVAARIHERVRERLITEARCPLPPSIAVPTPEELAIGTEEARLVRQHLSQLPGRGREILIRAYILEQTKEQICEEMNLTSTQYRLFKSRAKARLRRSLSQFASRSELAQLRTKGKIS